MVVFMILANDNKKYLRKLSQALFIKLNSV